MGKSTRKPAKIKARIPYRDLDPLEQGGTIARKGFAYQDHVAAGKCLDMLTGDGPTEVWCEAEDDIVLVWLIQGEEWFEFVQVKSNQLNQLWSVAKLCEKEPAKDGEGAGACIVEKSLTHDRGDGKCRFRIVTCREPHSDLAVLKLALDDIARTRADSGLTTVITDVVGRVNSFKSENGNGAEFWVRMTVWEYTPANGPNCYLCHQPIVGQANAEHAGAKRRLAFEIEQLEGEEAELKQLLERLNQEQDVINSRVRQLDEELADVETRLRPVRTAFAALIPPEVAVIDTEIGQNQERIAQLLRLRKTFLQRDELSREIDNLQAKVEELSGAAETEAGKVPFEQLSDELSDGINEYLNILNEDDQSRWPHGTIRFELKEGSYRIKVGQKLWSSLGATSIGYVLLGYHYALLKLSGREGNHYPGIALIDFPMTLADKTTIADKENYLIEPFIRLFKSTPTFQLIVCGRAFENLQGVHRVNLTTVWKQEHADGLTASQ